MPNQRAANTRSQDFRYVFANTFGITFGPQEVQVVFGIQSEPGTDSVTMEEQVGIIYTHVAAKLLAESLLHMIDNFEKATGSIVPLDQSKIDALDEMLARVMAAHSNSKNPT
jgi:Protein of unknown function (DUF3467)